MFKNCLKTTMILSLIAVFSISCNQSSSKKDDDSDSTKGNSQIKEPVANMTAVCLWSSVTLRETPQIKGKYKNAIYLGEKATYMGEKVTDSVDAKNKKEFVKIKLTDGTQGWVQSNMVAIGGKAYAIKEKTKLYKRPDILSVGKEEFDKMQFVVSTEEQGDWIKIKGKQKSDKWFKEGWVKLDRLAGDEIDVTVAVLAERALLKDTEDKRLEALKEITGNPDFSNSIFISDVRALSEGQNTPIQEQQSTDYIQGD